MEQRAGYTEVMEPHEMSKALVSCINGDWGLNTLNFWLSDKRGNKNRPTGIFLKICKGMKYKDFGAVGLKEEKRGKKSEGYIKYSGEKEMFETER